MRDLDTADSDVTEASLVSVPVLDSDTEVGCDVAPVRVASVNVGLDGSKVSDGVLVG